MVTERNASRQHAPTRTLLDGEVTRIQRYTGGVYYATITHLQVITVVQERFQLMVGLRRNHHHRKGRGRRIVSFPGLHHVVVCFSTLCMCTCGCPKNAHSTYSTELGLRGRLDGAVRDFPIFQSPPCVLSHENAVLFVIIANHQRQGPMGELETLA